MNVSRVVRLLLAAALVAGVPVHAGAEAASEPAAAETATPAETDTPPEPAPSEATPAPMTETPPLPSPRPPDKTASGGAADNSICLMIESAARAHELPVEFFARVIWQESRFQARAIGPLTRSGERAQGIAQFMPGTAAERSLLDPFDPVQALPKSAEFLRELHAEFGNLGLAAAAYNAGPRRVREWLAGTGYMPQETRSYVAAITGMTVDDWAAARAQPGKERAMPATLGCAAMMALLKRAPNPFVEELTHRVALGAVKPWGVQLAAGFSRDRALTVYSRLMSRFNAILSEHDPSLLSTLLRSRGTRAFYQVRVGADTRGAADDLCGRIRRAGGACMVLRNARGSG